MDLDPSEFTDHYAAALEAVIAQKVSEGDAVPVGGEPEEAGGDVVDLLSALQRSVAKARAARGEDAGPAGDGPDDAAGSRRRRARAGEELAGQEAEPPPGVVVDGRTRPGRRRRGAAPDRVPARALQASEYRAAAYRRAGDRLRDLPDSEWRARRADGAWTTVPDVGSSTGHGRGRRARGPDPGRGR